MRIIFFDLETGGLDWIKHPIIQLAAVAVDAELNEIESFECKLKFDMASADPEALLMNHYDSDVWEKDAIEQKDAISRFGKFLNKYSDIERISMRGNPYRVAQLAGHNAQGFDFEFVRHLYKVHNAFLPASYRVLDTLQRASWFFFENPELPKPEDLKLGTLAKHFGVEVDGSAHDALTDARMTIGIYKRMVELDGVRNRDKEALL